MFDNGCQAMKINMLIVMLRLINIVKTICKDGLRSKLFDKFALMSEQDVGHVGQAWPYTHTDRIFFMRLLCWFEFIS